jgi:hypothetical protein
MRLTTETKAALKAVIQDADNRVRPGRVRPRSSIISLDIPPLSFSKPVVCNSPKDPFVGNQESSYQQLLGVSFSEWNYQAKGPVLFRGWLTGWSLPNFWQNMFLRASSPQPVETDLCGLSAEEAKDGDWLHPAELPVKVGTDKTGANVELRLRDFLHYVATDAFNDPEPLFVFDDDLHLKLPSLSDHYTTPQMFAWTPLQDIFAYSPEHTRPAYKWHIFGPARTGSLPHVDPYLSHAWNALLLGRKRWLVFPGWLAQQLEDSLHLTTAAGGVEMGAGLWFSRVYGSPLLQAKLRAHASHVFEFVQEAGDTVYVPKGWCHAVVNLDFTVAVTHNFTVAADGAAVRSAVREARAQTVG